MLVKIMIIFLSSSVHLFCNNNGDGKPSNLNIQAAKPDSLVINPNAMEFTTEKKNNKSNGYYTKISSKSVIKILSANKSLDTTSKFLQLYSAKCNDWTLNKKNIANIFLSCNQIDGQEVHHYYDVLPCQYSGKATIDGRLASYELNAGAFAVLIYKDTSIYLGYKKENYKEYFLTGPGIE